MTTPEGRGRAIVVCGAEDDRDPSFVCILPPDHAEHTATESGVVWHKAVNNRGNGIEFATTPPGYEPPKLTDLAGLFADAPIAISEKRYYVGYYCPRGSGHWELVGNEDYTRECGSKGWDLYLDGASPDDEALPPGEWV